MIQMQRRHIFSNESINNVGKSDIQLDPGPNKNGSATLIFVVTVKKGSTGLNDLKFLPRKRS